MLFVLHIKHHVNSKIDHKHSGNIGGNHDKT